jgi:DNA-binding NtrC family response regulator
LIVDDEQDIAEILMHLLEKNGFKVCGFSDPLKALEHFISNPRDYGVVVSDIRMPHMTGFELVRKIKDIKPEIKIILMTAFEINNSEFKKVLPNTKVDGFLQKPVRAEKLVEMVIRYGR